MTDSSNTTLIKKSSQVTDEIQEFHPVRDFWHRLYSSKTGIVGLIIICIVLFISLLAPLLAPYSPVELHVIDRLQPPSGKYLLGTDNYGRDLLSRVLFGARFSLKIGLMVAIFTSLIGGLIGLVAGYYSHLDNILMRIMDALMSFPAILLAIAIMAALGPSGMSTIFALTVVYTPRTARIVRGSVLSVKHNEYIEAIRAAGASNLRIIFLHILPNSLSPLIVQSSFIFAYAILAEAGLSFVGAGPPPPAPSWGNVLSEGRVYIREAPWLTVFPGMAITITVLGLNLLGDGLRDVLDPKLRS